MSENINDEFILDFDDVNNVGSLDFNDLINRPKYNGQIMTGETDIPEVIRYTAGENVEISEEGEISSTDTTYNDFIGTDGQAAGAQGLVPAPATTDAGKYLKADGTWDGVNAGPTVVQTTGTSTTDVMSQNAVTNELATKESKGAWFKINDIDPSLWYSLPDSDPYTAAYTFYHPGPLSPDAILELVNDDPVAFAKNGFAIGNVSVLSGTITVYSIGVPDDFVTLTFIRR